MPLRVDTVTATVRTTDGRRVTIQVTPAPHLTDYLLTGGNDEARRVLVELADALAMAVDEVNGKAA